MKFIKTLLGGVAGVALAATATAPAAANPWEHADLGDQGDEDTVLVADGAAIRRLDNGITAKVKMPTPAPGSYDYPTGPTASGQPGHPETFSTWVFVFFNPDACDGACGGPDLTTNPDVIAGAFNGGGHVVGGPNLTISGHVNGQSRLFGGTNAETIDEALALGYTIADAEIHVAVAPHGALDPELLPAAITTPAGDPSFWWVAKYE